MKVECFLFQSNADGAQQVERRARVRYSRELSTLCKPAPEWYNGHWWQAVVQDVSVGGLGLLICRRFEPGAILAVDVQTPEAERPRELFAKVVRVVEKDGNWLHGCELISTLDEDGAQGLIQCGRAG
jgi:hypothetical protein